jgi:hypothetical protein
LSQLRPGRSSRTDGARRTPQGDSSRLRRQAATSLEKQAAKRNRARKGPWPYQPVIRPQSSASPVWTKIASVNALMASGSRRAGRMAENSRVGSAPIKSFRVRPLRSLPTHFGGFTSARNGSAVSDSCETPLEKVTGHGQPSATFSALARKNDGRHGAHFQNRRLMSDTTRLSPSRMRFSYVIARFFHLHRRDLQQR